jgi:hypothetical protein
VQLLPEDRAVAAVEAACVHLIGVFGGVAKDDQGRFLAAFDQKQLERENDQAVLEALADGTFVGSGFDSRLPVDAARVTIPPDRWRSLTIDFRSSTATGFSFSITDIMVSRGQQVHSPVPLPVSVDTLADLANPARNLERWHDAWSDRNPLASDTEALQAAQEQVDPEVSRAMIRNLRQVPGVPRRRGRKRGKSESQNGRPT